MLTNLVRLRRHLLFYRSHQSRPRLIATLSINVQVTAVIQIIYAWFWQGRLWQMII